MVQYWIQKGCLHRRDDLLFIAPAAAVERQKEIDFFGTFQLRLLALGRSPLLGGGGGVIAGVVRPPEHVSHLN